jgi:putative Mg2+ transporter-C (MgtC) family protein
MRPSDAVHALRQCVNGYASLTTGCGQSGLDRAGIRARALLTIGRPCMSVTAEIGDALAREFALPDAGTTTVIVVRLLTATVLGGMLGLERESKGRAAGLKTHILVSIGSALFVMAPLLSGIAPGEVTRVMQGIVSGIGFLGAGAIIKLERDERIEGLTTAAGIWMVSAVGMAAGMGMEVLALVTTLIGLAVVNTIPRIMRSEGA